MIVTGLLVAGGWTLLALVTGLNFGAIAHAGSRDLDEDFVTSAPCVGRHRGSAGTRRSAFAIGGD